MSEQLRARLQPVRNRQKWQRLLQTTSWGLLIGGVVACMLALLRPLGVPVHAGWILGTLGAGSGLGVLAGLVRGWSWHRAASAVDRHYNLKDRVVSALAFSGGAKKPATPTVLYDLQISDALERLAGMDARQVAPVVVPRLLPAAVATVVGAFCLLLLPNGARTVEARPVSLAHVESEAAHLKETMLKELRALAEGEEAVEPEFEELVERLVQLVEDLGQQGVDERAALAKLSEMQMAIAVLQSQYDLETVDAHFKAVAEALKRADATKAAAEALAEGDYNKAADSLEGLDASQMLRKESASVAKELKKLSESLAEANQGQLSQAASEMSEGLEKENQSQCKSGACKMAGLCRAQSLRKKIGECLSCQIGRLAECKGNCAGGGNGQNARNGGNNVARSDKASLNWGTGASGNAFGDEATDLGGKRDRVDITGMHGEGPSEKETLASPEGRETARRGYREKYQEYRKMAEAVAQSEALPLGHRQIIRSYFESIRPDAGEAEAVEAVVE
jgi:hypothetical protein